MKSLLGLNSFWFQSEKFSDLITTYTNLYKNSLKLVPSEVAVLEMNSQYDTNKYSMPFFFMNTVSLLKSTRNTNKSFFNYTHLNYYLNQILFSQTKQERVLNNWRFLKLTREGWRCRLLSARHQRSLYKRYVNENELIWIAERNAKDLLPG